MSVTLHTNYGPLKIQLYCDLTPLTCRNFLGLCASSYYDNKTFHRNITNFIIQGGKGGQSIYYNSEHNTYEFDDEIVLPTLSHNKRGLVCMANKHNQHNTNTSQFYITYNNNLSQELDGQNTIFGILISQDSYNTLDILEQLPVDNKDKPIQPIVIQNVTIHANPFAM